MIEGSGMGVEWAFMAKRGSIAGYAFIIEWGVVEILDTDNPPITRITRRARAETRTFIICSLLSSYTFRNAFCFKS
jgi:hypothetical protein